MPALRPGDLRLLNEPLPAAGWPKAPERGLLTVKIGFSFTTCLNEGMTTARQFPIKRFVPPGAFRLFVGGSPEAFTMEIHAEAHGAIPFHRAAVADEVQSRIPGPFHLQTLIAAGATYRVFVAESCPVDSATAILLDWLASYHPEMTETSRPNFS
jgi:hypothetical protein